MPYRWNESAGRVVRQPDPDENEPGDDIWASIGAEPPVKPASENMAPGDPFESVYTDPDTREKLGISRDALGNLKITSLGVVKAPAKTPTEKYQGYQGALAAAARAKPGVGSDVGFGEYLKPADLTRQEQLDIRKLSGLPELEDTKQQIERGTDPRTGRRYIFDPNTGAFEWIDAAPSTGPQWRTGEFEIAQRNVDLATQAAEDARNQWQMAYDAGRDDARERQAYNNALLELQKADRLLNQLKQQQDVDYQNRQLGQSQGQFEATMGYNRERGAEQTRQFEVQAQQERERQAHQKQQDEIGRLFGIAQSTGYVPIALLKMSAPDYLEKQGGR